MTEKVEPDFYGGHGYMGDGIHGCDVMLGGSVVRCGAGIMQHMWVDKMTDQHMETTMNEFEERLLLQEYSEWLDGQGLVVGDGMTMQSLARKVTGQDQRTHEELVKEFLDGRR